MMQPKAAVILKKIADFPHEAYKIKEANVHVIRFVVLSMFFLCWHMLTLSLTCSGWKRRPEIWKRPGGEIVERGGLGTSGFMCN